MIRLFENIQQWRLPDPASPAGTGLAILQLLVIYILFRYFLNNIVGRIVVSIATKGLTGDQKSREARAQTLAGVVRSAGNYVLTFIIVLVAFKRFGVDTTPVLASASVIGLAVGFGSQKLVRDVTTGFFLLAENQFDVGDYVTIGGVTGVVEEIGMRTTRIRDDFGKLHILSNGDISVVCNYSAGPMSVFLDVSVAAGEDMARVRASVAAASRRIEEDLGESIQSAPSVDGVTAMSGAQFTVRIRCRVVAAQQDRIQIRLREILREQLIKDGITLA